MQRAGRKGEACMCACMCACLHHSFLQICPVNTRNKKSSMGLQLAYIEMLVLARSMIRGTN